MPRASTQTQTKAATAAANSKTKKSGEAKPKRAPSAYNLYVAKHLAAWKQENPGKPIKEGMSAVAAKWKDDPENPKNNQNSEVKKPASGKENSKKPASKASKPPSAQAVAAAA